jgi:hypothetical protein
VLAFALFDFLFVMRSMSNAQNQNLGGGRNSGEYNAGGWYDEDLWRGSSPQAPPRAQGPPVNRVPSVVNESGQQFYDANAVRPSVSLEGWQDASSDHLPNQPPAAGAGPQSGGLAAKTLGAAAAIGGGAGLLLVGGPIGLVAGAAGLAYASTRSDGVGKTTRTIADASVGAVEKAADIDRKHGITTSLKNALWSAWKKTKQVERDYQITEKIKTGAVATASKAMEVNEKYGIANKVGAGVSAGALKITSLVSCSEVQQPLSGDGLGGSAIHHHHIGQHDDEDPFHQSLTGQQ